MDSAYKGVPGNPSFTGLNTTATGQGNAHSGSGSGSSSAVCGALQRQLSQGRFGLIKPLSSKEFVYYDGIEQVYMARLSIVCKLVTGCEMLNLLGGIVTAIRVQFCTSIQLIK